MCAQKGHTHHFSMINAHWNCTYMQRSFNWRAWSFALKIFVLRSISNNGNGLNLVYSWSDLVILTSIIFTARKWSCGKVIFSQASVHSRSRGWLHHLHHGIGHMVVYPLTSGLGTYSPPRHKTWVPTPPTATYIWWSSLETCSNVSTCGPTSIVLTSSGGHWNMHSWEVGSTHPTGMLSC